MPKDTLPDAVREFIFKYIDSVELLDALIYLRAQPDSFFSAREISDQLRTSPVSIANRLQNLVNAGIIECLHEEPPKYGFLANDAQIAQLLDKVAEAYKVRRYRIYELIYSPLRKISTFADAFIVSTGPKKSGDENG